jgi:hypothetical protein
MSRNGSVKEKHLLISTTTKQFTERVNIPQLHQNIFPKGIVAKTRKTQGTYLYNNKHLGVADLGALPTQLKRTLAELVVVKSRPAAVGGGGGAGVGAGVAAGVVTSNCPLHSL